MVDLESIKEGDFELEGERLFYKGKEIGVIYFRTLYAVKNF